MCWSAKVSFGFGSAHWLCLAHLLRRNQKHDAWYVMALAPLAIQETLQFFGWLLINREGNDSFTCSTMNKLVNSLLILSVGFLPTAFCLFARSLNADKTCWRQKVITATTALSMCYYCFLCSTQLFFSATATDNMICNNVHGPDDPTPGVCPQCLHEGPNGHQVWAVKIVPFMYGYLSLVLLPYNWLPTIALGLTKPRWPSMGLVVLFWLMYLPTRIMLSRDFEYMSVWCWTGVVLQGVALADPFVRKSLHSISEKKDATEVKFTRLFLGPKLNPA